MTQRTQNKERSIFLIIMAGTAGAFGIWALMAFVTGLSSVDYQAGEMLRHFLVATGNLGEYETLVDFYTHIKGVEYLMAGAFFVAFPIFFKYINQADKAPGIKT
ncbi:MAG: hypothetical protein RI601_02100 [Desulfurivibrionaceae bacterium]|nr:hypothetical protein [Desulfurivibrionaceae bacterium]